MKFIINIFLSYLVFVYIVRPFFAGLFGEKQAAQDSHSKQQDRRTTQPNNSENYTDYEVIE